MRSLINIDDYKDKVVNSEVVNYIHKKIINLGLFSSVEIKKEILENKELKSFQV